MHTRLALRHTFNDIDESDTRKMLGENAARLYDFDLEKLAPLVEKSGPTVTEISLPLEEHEFPENPHTNAFRRRE